MALRIAQVEAIPDLGFDSLSDPPDAATIERLGPLLPDGAEGGMDPIAVEVLQVVNQASLMVAVDLSYGTDTSIPTIWATPRRAVMSNSIDRSQVMLEPVPINQLPQLLAQLIVLRPSAFVGDGPLSVEVETLSTAVGQASREEAIQVLASGGLNPEQAVLLLDLHLPEVRRWVVSSSWSTESGPAEANLQGLDAGPCGQWLESFANGWRTFTPLGHGDTINALRNVLPRNWMGTPLSLPPA